MKRKSYPTDLSDMQWRLIARFFRRKGPHAGKQPTAAREVVNAIFWHLRAGSGWRLLPHDFPPWRTVYGWFRKWTNDGTWDRVLDKLRPKARLASGRDPSPRLVIIDSQTVKTTESGGPRGFDGNKKIKGRKRNVAVDSEGFTIAVEVRPANQHDSKAAPDVLAAAKRKEPSLTKGLGDSAYTGRPVKAAAAKLGIDFEVVKHPKKESTFIPLPQRWKVERSFPWAGRYRRLSKDYERTSGIERGFHESGGDWSASGAHRKIPGKPIKHPLIPTLLQT